MPHGRSCRGGVLVVRPMTISDFSGAATGGGKKRMRISLGLAALSRRRYIPKCSETEHVSNPTSPRE